MDWMDARLLDVLIGVTGFVVLVILLAVLPLVISAGTGDVTGFSLFSGKVSDITAGQDISDIALYIQNTHASDISVIMRA